MSSMKHRFENAVDKLHMYFGLVSRQDLLSAIMAGTDPKDSKKRTLEAMSGKKPTVDPNVFDITALFQSQERAYFAHEIVSQLDEFKSKGGDTAKELEKAINVICEKTLNFGKYAYKPMEDEAITTSLNEFTSYIKIGSIKDKKVELKSAHTERETKEAGGPPTKLNENPTEPSKETPTLSANVVNNSMMHPGARQTDGASIFLNGIPTLEMSKCVPYLDILVNSASEPLSADGKVNSISLLQFFGGNFEAKDANEIIAKSKDIRIKNFVAPKAAKDKVKAKTKSGDLAS